MDDFFLLRELKKTIHVKVPVWFREKCVFLSNILSLRLRQTLTIQNLEQKKSC